MRWKRIILVSLAVAALALSMYAVSLAYARIRIMQTTETDRAEAGCIGLSVEGSKLGRVSNG